MKKSRLFSGLFVYVLFVLNSGNVVAGLVNIDFNDLAPGTPVTTQYQSQGVTLSLIGSALSGPYTYALEEVDGTPLNIFGASGNAINPGDNTVPPYWAIEFQFSTPVDYFSILALDSEEIFSVTAYINQQIISAPLSLNLLGTKDTSPFRGPVYSVELGSIGGGTLYDRVVISPNGDIPEVFDNLQFNAVPIPPALWLFGSGLLGLIGIAKKKK
jgi:hypothetical protein